MPDAAKPDPGATAREEPAIDITGRTLGDFQVLRKLGQGGMGQVYLARQLSLKREVALKILRKELAENATALKRFQAEAEAVARISHPNIVQVFAIGEHEGLRYMALEYVEGRNLRDYLERKGPPELPVALAIMRQVAAALQRANELGLVHRDIKPENILLNRKVEVKVTDFGLSRYYAGEGRPVSITQSGMTLGTPLYMSPEQVQGRPVDHRSDLYSFGVTCYHLLCGYPPFQGTNAFDVAIQHVQGQAEPLSQIRPDLPPDLCAVIQRLMAKSPDERYPSAKEVLRDLAKIQKGLSLGWPLPVGSLAPGAQVGPPINLQVSLSGSSVGGVVLAPSTSSLPVAAPPTFSSRWPWRMLALLATFGFALGGWFLYAQWHPISEAGPAPVTPGLPDTRPPAPQSTLERQLKERFKNKQPLFDSTSAGLKLALHYVHERRWDEAGEIFREMESSRLPKGVSDWPKSAGEHLLPPHLLGRLGSGIVLAQQDKAKESVEAFKSASLMLQQKSAVPKAEIELFFLEHPEFGQALADALYRNHEVAPLPRELDWLRTPSGVIRGPRP